jgi:hypothetical protein
MSIAPYFFANCHMIVTCAGITADVLNGTAPGDDTVEFERDEDAFNVEVGSDGTMIVSGNTNKTGTVTVKLSQLSPNNSKFNAMLNLQENPPTFSPLSFGFQDSSRQDLAAGLSGVILKAPKMGRGVKASVQEWKFKVDKLRLVFGNPVLPLLAQGAAGILGGT